MRKRGVRVICTQLVSLSAYAALLTVAAVGQSLSELSAATSVPASSVQGTVAEPATGSAATGTVTIAGPLGEESGSITVAAWGADHCKVTITLGAPVLRRSYTAVMNGTRAVVTGPAGLLRAAPLPVSARLGCAFLPSGIAYGKLAAGASLSLDGGGRPLALNWTERGQPTALQYSDYTASGGIDYPGTLTESVAGRTTLSVHFESVSARTFSDSDFVLPPRPAPAPHKAAAAAGGGQ